MTKIKLGQNIDLEKKGTIEGQILPRFASIGDITTALTKDGMFGYVIGDGLYLNIQGVVTKIANANDEDSTTGLAFYSATEPTDNVSIGSLWFDTSSDLLKINNGYVWVTITKEAGTLLTTEQINNINAVPLKLDKGSFTGTAQDLSNSIDKKINITQPIGAQGRTFIIADDGTVSVSDDAIGGASNLQETTTVGAETTDEIIINRNKNFSGLKVASNSTNDEVLIHTNQIGIANETMGYMSAFTPNGLVFSDFENLLNSLQIVAPNVSTMNDGIKTITYPYADGVVALEGDLVGKVPYTGANANVDLGLFSLISNNLVEVATKGKFLTPLKSDTTTPYFRLQTEFWNGTTFVATKGTGFGLESLQNNSGSDVTAYGFGAAHGNSGNGSNAFGVNALRNNTGLQSSGFGFNALHNNTGQYTSGFGTNVLQNNSGVSSNAFGYQAMYNNSGDYSNGFGYDALHSNTGGSAVGIGHSSMRSNSGDKSIGIGQNAGQNNTGNNLIAIGEQTGLGNTGFGNVAIGENSMYQNTSSLSIAIGQSASYFGVGNYNIALGHFVAEKSRGSLSIMMGNFSGRYNTSDSLIAMGENSGRLNHGYGNIFIGQLSGGAFIHDTDNIQTVADNNTDIDFTNNEITITNHGFGANGTYINVEYTNSETAIGGLVNNTIYFVQIISTNIIKFENITSIGLGVHTFTPQKKLNNVIGLGENSTPLKSHQIMLGNDHTDTEVFTHGLFKTGKDKVEIIDPKHLTTKEYVDDKVLDPQGLFAVVKSGTISHIPKLGSVDKYFNNLDDVITAIYDRIVQFNPSLRYTHGDYKIYIVDNYTYSIDLPTNISSINFNIEIISTVTPTVNVLSLLRISDGGFNIPNGTLNVGKYSRIEANGNFKCNAGVISNTETLPVNAPASGTNYFIFVHGGKYFELNTETINFTHNSSRRYLFGPNSSSQVNSVKVRVQGLNLIKTADQSLNTGQLFNLVGVDESDIRIGLIDYNGVTKSSYNQTIFQSMNSTVKGGIKRISKHFLEVGDITGTNTTIFFHIIKDYAETDTTVNFNNSTFDMAYLRLQDTYFSLIDDHSKITFTGVLNSNITNASIALLAVRPTITKTITTNNSHLRFKDFVWNDSGVGFLHSSTVYESASELKNPVKIIFENTEFNVQQKIIKFNDTAVTGTRQVITKNLVELMGVNKFHYANAVDYFMEVVNTGYAPSLTQLIVNSGKISHNATNSDYTDARSIKTKEVRFTHEL